MRTQKTSLFDGIPMRGDLCVIVRDSRTGEQLRRIEIRNKIMFLAADVLVELLAQRTPPTDPAPAYQQLGSMRMGVSNTAASRSDTALGSQVVYKLLADVNKTSGVPGELQLSATLEAGDANGFTLCEAGLFTKGSGTGIEAPSTTPGSVRMFSRQVHPAIPKTAALTLQYIWRIAFTA